ncbi:hypothetical protein GCM10027341_17010 [Spirosoma knui]
MAMPPVAEKKWQPGALVDKENFRIGTLLIRYQTDPVLAKHPKIQPQMNHIPL